MGFIRYLLEAVTNAQGQQLRFDRSLGECVVLDKKGEPCYGKEKVTFGKNEAISNDQVLKPDK